MPKPTRTPNFEDKTQINKRVSARYDFLMERGQHGHYENMFRCVHEELALQLAALQSPAGEWRDISTAEKKSGKEIIGAIFKGAEMLREPFISFWSPTLNRFYANPTHYVPYPLPPAPTGEVK